MKFEEYILEMAARQKDAVSSIEHILPITVTHIFKCLLMPDDSALNHHIHDVIEWLDQMDEFADTKAKRARPTQSLLLKEYTAKFGELRLNNAIHKVTSKYDIKRKIDVQERKGLHEFVKEFFEEFFLDIEKNTVDLVKYEKILRKKANSLRKN